jgi:E3 SUMO-protein ligase PIAS1
VHFVDVAFPSQLEVKVNDQEVRANFKGLKNKPGSTRPADITAFVTKQTGFTNRILTTYALTQKVGDTPSPKDAQVRKIDMSP